METKLAENIRLMRKKKSMTQEQLAEALGVTVGAVHKWETKLSTPELSLILEMADFFETSVDALVGYEIRDNRKEAMLERLAQYIRNLNPLAREEAEKLLARYPNSFQAVSVCAAGYLVYGATTRNPDDLSRAVQLLEKSRTLLSQNDDPRVSDATICGDLAMALFLQGQPEKSLDLLKRNNTGGVFSSSIGILLAVFLRRPEEAAEYLTEALLNCLGDMLNAVMGYVFLFRSRKDWASALDVTRLGMNLLAGLQSETKSGALEKTTAELLALLAWSEMKNGLLDDARCSLQRALEEARSFDSAPDYSLKAIRFADRKEQQMIYDVLGASAEESVERLIGLMEDPDFFALWQEVKRHE